MDEANAQGRSPSVGRKLLSVSAAVAALLAGVACSGRPEINELDRLRAENARLRLQQPIVSAPIDDGVEVPVPKEPTLAELQQEHVSLRYYLAHAQVSRALAVDLGKDLAKSTDTQVLMVENTRLRTELVRVRKLPVAAATTPPLVLPQSDGGSSAPNHASHASHSSHASHRSHSSHVSSHR